MPEVTVRYEFGPDLLAYMKQHGRKKDCLRTDPVFQGIAVLARDLDKQHVRWSAFSHSAFINVSLGLKIVSRRGQPIRTMEAVFDIMDEDIAGEFAEAFPRRTITLADLPLEPVGTA